MALRQSPHFTGNSYVLKQNKAAANGTKNTRLSPACSSRVSFFWGVLKNIYNAFCKNRFYLPTSSFCISSSDFSLVSGSFNAKTNVNADISANTPNV